MTEPRYPVGTIPASDVDHILSDDSTSSFALDTAGSWDGSFPEPGPDDYLVTVDTLDGETIVLVSRRYVGAIDAADAAEQALDAVAERNGYDTDAEGEILPIWVCRDTGDRVDPDDVDHDPDGQAIDAASNEPIDLDRWDLGVPAWVVRVDAVVADPVDVERVFADEYDVDEDTDGNGLLALASDTGLGPVAIVQPRVADPNGRPPAPGDVVVHVTLPNDDTIAILVRSREIDAHGPIRDRSRVDVAAGDAVSHAQEYLSHIDPESYGDLDALIVVDRVVVLE